MKSRVTKIIALMGASTFAALAVTCLCWVDLAWHEVEGGHGFSGAAFAFFFVTVFGWSLAHRPRRHQP